VTCSLASWKASRSPLATRTRTSRRLRDRGGEEVVGLVAWSLGIGEAAGGDEFGERLELVDELRIEVAAALIGGEEALPVGRRAQRVPADQDRARPLAFVEAEQDVGEAENRAAAAVAGAADRFRQRVVGAVREGIAVDDEEGRARLSGHRARA
jgi:hypothetical protein